MAFKDMLAADIPVFLDPNFFGEPHIIDGKTVICVIDDNSLKTRQAGSELAVAESSRLIYAAVADLPPRRMPGAALNVDHREYIIDDWAEDEGVATIALRLTI